jgi:hypothetical protein
MRTLLLALLFRQHFTLFILSTYGFQEHHLLSHPFKLTSTAECAVTRELLHTVPNCVMARQEKEPKKAKFELRHAAFLTHPPPMQAVDHSVFTITVQHSEA